MYSTRRSTPGPEQRDRDQFGLFRQGTSLTGPVVWEGYSGRLSDPSDVKEVRER